MAGKRRRNRSEKSKVSKKSKLDDFATNVVLDSSNSPNKHIPPSQTSPALENLVQDLQVATIHPTDQHGVVLTSTEFVPLPCFMDAAASLELSIQRNSIPMICGPMGCGKSILIDYVARKLKASTSRVQISEQTDTKTLIGMYCCSDTPGVFVWRPGPLVHCMTSGKWLILEDVDKGSADLPILLSPLLRQADDSISGLLHPNTGNPVIRHPDFRLILTRRTVAFGTSFSQLNSVSDIYATYCCMIYMQAMTSSAIERIVCTRFPSVLPIAKRLLAEFALLKNMSTTSSSDERSVTPRDFLKFCARANSLADIERNAEGLYLDAIDCFVCSQPPSQLREKLAITLGGLFNFTTDRSSDLWKDRKPELYLNTQMTKVIAGRVSIPAKRSIQWELQLSSMASTSGPFAGQTFADTRLACSLIERLAAAVYHKEPVLLVGETGTGKTSSIQRLALMAGRRLRVLNLNQQSDSVDLLGGFKPVDNRALINPTRERFESLFVRTFRMETNKQFLHHIQTCSATGRWRDLLSLMRHPAITAISRLSVHKDNTEVDDEAGKKARPNVTEWKALLSELDSLQARLASAERAGQPSLAFAFIEGALVRAVKEGDWVLLDEINLAPAELLDCLSGLLDSSAGSLTLVDRGDLEPVKRHPSFHLFAAMNPSTDVGKRSLPIGLRNRFTEIYVDELNPAASTVDMNDLTLLIRTYLVGLSPSAAQIAAVVQLYTAIRRAAVEGLVDGVGQRPYFSLRTLCRALTEASRGYHGSLLRSLYEGFLFSFGSQVGRSSRPALEKLIQTHLLSTVVSSSVGKQKTSPEALSRQLFSRPLPSPVSKSPVTAEAEDFVCVEGYWIPKGPLAARAVAVNCVADGDYILTTSVRANLKDLARVVAAAGSLPVLLQGETSVGKTSLITYLAERVGQVCHRINNHEHTDLQTYLGTYTASSVSESAVSSRDDIPSARPLVFQEGIFVQAMRKGHWIILDELNLAPTEILEALNRVLDENRELFITETQEMVRAHPHFRVFATQNPPGLYAGRKVLSRALRNRFVELHFDPLPRNELEIILEHRSALPPSRAKKLVEVMHQLQLLRRSSEVFQGKDGFITLRDLFRWGERYRLASCVEASSDAGQQSFDWDTYLAEQGYLLLGGRARRAEEAAVVAEVIRKTFNRQINERNLFDHHSGSSLAVAEFLALASSKGVTSTAETGQSEKKLSNEFEHVVWTRDMRRLLVLVGNALKYKEPVLLVGETGCGKTTICQIFANIRGQQLHCVNCHQYTEASDFLGGLRPVRGSDGPSCTDNMESDSTVDNGRLFEWVDGPLVKAMLSGDMFLLDEISLADDAVLERLNSILEPERRLCLAERCGEGGEVSLASAENDDPAANIVAATDFRLVATMNPGGDYAKKELSPALRNRFTEIWCPSPLFSKLPPSAVCSSTANTVVETTVEGLEDWRSIVEHNFVLRSGNPDLVTRLWRPLAASMVDFCWWFAFKRNETVGCSTCRRPMPTVRDLLAWVEFVHNITDTHGSAQPDMFSTYTTSCLHGACLLFLDSLQNTNDDNVEGQDVRAWFGDIWEQRGKISDDLFPFSQVGGLSYLFARLLIHFDATVVESNHLSQQMLEAAVRVMETVDSAGPVTHAPPLPCLTDSNARYGIPPFLIETGPLVSPELVDSTHAPLPFSLAAPTPAFNLCRLLRALQLPRRALLLEGSPGVGKTSLVMALARASGHKVVRINLSEATEASDLFGCDLPVEGASCGTFAWSDGPLLQALRHGHWILLDEMNLASQSVLECLNACLDHRGSIFIPELGATFHVKPRATRLFACQNPVEEGGGRKALPKSFLNRFTQVYLKPLTLADQQVVLSSLYPSIPRSSVTAMVNFNAAIHNAVVVKHSFGASGGPWEFNLRDLCRWADLVLKGQANFGMNPGLYVCLLYAGRMRTAEDKQKVMDLWHEVAASVAATEADFDEATSRCYLPQGRLSVLGDKHLQVGLASFRILDQSAKAPVSQLLLLHQHRPYLELLLKTLELGWMPIVVGPRGSGKRSLVHLAAYLTRNKISSLSLSPSADTVELLGAFEQQEAGGVFAWIDSPLVKGIREGHWVMLENAQLCSPSVLDRLNGLLEPGGELILSERGLDASGNLVRLTPHPNFRFILTVDEEPLSAGPGATNISRAMRNRGVELALTHDLTVSHEDVHRLLLAMRLPNQHAAALLHFDTACAQSIPHLLLHPTSAEGTEEGSQLTLLQSSRKLPIGALLSAGLILQQLLDLLPGDDEFSKSDLLAWTAGPVNETECCADGAVWLLQSKYSRVQRAYLKVLEDVYVRRHQTDRRLAQAYHEAVLQFVENDLPTILNREHHVPSSPVHLIDQAPLVNRVTDLLKPVPGSINRPLPGVGHWLDCLRLALQDLPSEPSPSLDNHDAVPFLLRRQIMERLPLAGEKTAAAISSPLRSSVLSSVLESAEEFTKVGSTDLPDLRWIPGWRVLMNADPTILPMDPEKLVKSWDRHLVHTYFNHLCSYFAHVDQLLAAEADAAGNSQKPQLSLPPDLPVLVAAAKLVRGDYPAAWSETYPGLMHLRREWKKGVRMHLEAHLTAASIDLYELLRSTGRLFTWIHLFASTALGSPSDWPERIEFYRSKARITDLTAPPERVLVLLHRHRIAPQPRSEDSVSFGRRRPSSLLSTSWAALAAAVCDQLAAAAVNEDYASTKNDSDYEMLTAGKTEETAPFTLPIGSRLWPLLASIAVLVSMQSFSATGAYDCGSVTLAWNPINSQRPPIELGLSLGALCRPTLLKLLATSTSSETLGSVGWLQTCLLLLCGTSSSLSPSEIFNQPGLRIPDVKNEWGSLSQALFLTNCGNRLSSTLGPQSTQYRCSPQTITCSFADWLLHQQTSCDIYHLLIRFSDPCLQRMTANFTAEFDEAVTLSERLLLSISTALGRAWPEKIPVSSCDALTPERSTSTDLSCRMNALNSQLGLVLETLPPNSPVRLKTLLMRFASLLQDLPALLPSVVDMDVLSQVWLLWGCLQLLCACPVSPLDPTLVTAHKIAECERELAALSCDLSLRSAVNRVQFGSCGLPCLIANDSVISSANRVQPRHCGCTDSTTLLSNVAAGLEHPLVGAIVRRRDKVASRLEQLRSLRPSSLVSALLQLRQSSNAKYTELRSRLQTFTADFVEPLLALVSEQPNGASPADLVMKFTEAAAELSEWLLSPDRLHPYADIIEPYLLGLSKILRSLRLRMHASVFNIPQANDFVCLVELLSCGLFPLLACTGAPGDDPQQRKALSPYLELARQLVSQGTRARLRDLWLQPLSPHTTLKARSIFADAQEVQASKRLFAVRAMQADYRLSSYALDLLLLAVLSTSKLRHMETDDSALVARLLRALNCHLAVRWRRNEERLKRDAQRRAALFVEAESKRRRCLDQLQASTAGGRSQKKRKKSKKNADQEEEDRQLPALVDPDLDEEVEWRLRFPETGAIEARRCLLGGDNFSLEMNLSRDDQIRQAVNQIENVQSWLNRELASEETARDWLPPESELADFVNRLLYLLCLLSPLCPPQATENVEEVRSQHWWNTFMQGYQFAGDLVATANYPLPHSHDAVSSAAHLLATAKFALLAHSGNPETAGRNLFSLEPLLAVPASSQQLLRRKPYLDVYRDPIPFSEAHVAQSITERLRTRVQEVLREWPDHPALLKILVIIKRMGAFSMGDCLMKYITAFELLLTEIQEWEKNAAAYVSLSELFQAICDMLVDWRKTELKCWLAALDATTQATADRCAPLWFHLYSIFLQSSGPGNPSADESGKQEERCEALLELMENGPVGEFPARWRLLSALYSALKIWPGLMPEERTSSLQIVGNVVWFYGQFVAHVNKSLHEQQRVIRKEMKDFVAIMRWGDYVGFWSMKEKVDRCKKTIHKHVASWEAVLRQSVKPFFESAITVNIDSPLSPSLAETLNLALNARPISSVFPPSLLAQWLSQHQRLLPTSSLPNNVRRLPKLVSRLSEHAAHVATDAPCLSWINQLRDCLDDWSSRVRELSRATQQLDADSPPHKHLAVLLKGLQEPTAQQAIAEASKLSSEDIAKAKEWRSRYTALQQNKKLALVEWFRLCSGRRSLSSGVSEMTSLEPDDVVSEDLLLNMFTEEGEEGLSAEVLNKVDNVDVCLGLSYRRGLRQSLFEQPRRTLFARLSDHLWKTQPHCDTADKESNDHSNLQSSAAQCLGRLLAIRSALPRHPESPDVARDLGGRDGVERLLGCLDDLVLRCFDALDPLGRLEDTFQALQTRLLELDTLRQQSLVDDDATTADVQPCSMQALRCLKASRLRVAELASECVAQWTTFWETCSALQSTSERPSDGLITLLADNEDILPPTLATVPPALLTPSATLMTYRSRLEDIASRLNQPLPKHCRLITAEIKAQQEILATAAADLLTCCRDIGSDHTLGTEATLLTGLSRVANSIAEEIASSSCFLHSSEVGPDPTQPPLEPLVSDLIRTALLSAQTLHNLDIVEGADGHTDGLISLFTNTSSRLASACLPKLQQTNSQLRRLIGQVSTSTDTALPTLLNYLHCVTPLIQSLLYLVSIRSRQWWALLYAWLSVGEYMSRVVLRLLNDGFCKPSAFSKAAAAAGVGGESGKESTAGGEDSSAEGGDGGCTSLTAQGVDASGAKDVSDQLTTQEQIEGTQNDTEPPVPNSKPEESNSAQGIEMPDDFSGAFDDNEGALEGEEEEGERKEEDDPGLDEKMGKDLKSDDEQLDKEMWGDDEDVKSDEEQEDSADRKNAKSSSAGVRDPAGKSEQSKSTAKEEGEAAENSADEDREEQQQQQQQPDNGDEASSEADEQKKQKKRKLDAASGSGQETVAGQEEDQSEETDEGGPNQPMDIDLMKKDEERLAQGEADRLKAEEERENETEPNDLDDVEFGENEDFQPDPTEFDNLDEANRPDEEIDLRNQAMDLDEEEKETAKDGDLEVDETDTVEGERLQSMTELPSYQPSAGDLNSGRASSALDQQDIQGEPQHQDPTAKMDLPAPNQAMSDNMPPVEGASAGSAVRGLEDSFSIGARASTSPNPQSDESYSQKSIHQRNQGPRPTSERRTTAGDAVGQAKLCKKPDILEASSTDTQEEEAGVESTEAVQHIEEPDSSTNMTAFDAATDAQKEAAGGEQSITSPETEQSTTPGLDTESVLPRQVPEEEPVIKPLPPSFSDTGLSNQQRENDSSAAPGADIRTLPKPDTELRQTLGAQRPPESKHFLNTLDLPEVVEPLPLLQPQARTAHIDAEALATSALDWHACLSRSSLSSVQLCEALRLVLEPTHASRMKGDFRTGKRLNMRKIIPYLASHFRKDKIWMRRTQPNQRDYRILIAVDDSSSMADNLCRQMTFEALATVVSALHLLEAGKIGVCSFGESVRVVHGLGEPWSNEMGAAMLSAFTFTQTRTLLTELLLTALSIMQSAGPGSSANKLPTSQLLLILSDGVFSEDPQSATLQAAVRMARDAHLFVVCIIIDDARKKHSIFDLRRYAGPGRLLPYMDVFPLPYYLVLRDVTALPQLLADALRQWFELASAS